MKESLNRKVFDFKLTEPKIMELVEKYEIHPEDYPEDDLTPKLQAIYQGLNQWERIVMYAFAEHHSIRKLAVFFGVKPYYTRVAIANIKKKIDDNLKKSQRHNISLAWI